VVRKAISDEFYLLLLSKGEEFMSEDASAELGEYLSSMDILEESDLYQLFKIRWAEVLNPQN
jgi:hypothetical protein